jgi:hypothetical protein
VRGRRLGRESACRRSRPVEVLNARPAGSAGEMPELRRCR